MAKTKNPFRIVFEMFQRALYEPAHKLKLHDTLMEAPSDLLLWPQKIQTGAVWRYREHHGTVVITILAPGRHPCADLPVCPSLATF